jgi:hypothetical protein
MLLSELIDKDQQFYRHQEQEEHRPDYRGNP